VANRAVDCIINNAAESTVDRIRAVLLTVLLKVLLAALPTVLPNYPTDSAASTVCRALVPFVSTFTLQNDLLI
jgi:hypothetical protein